MLKKHAIVHTTELRCKYNPPECNTYLELIKMFVTGISRFVSVVKVQVSRLHLGINYNAALVCYEYQYLYVPCIFL